MAGKRSGYSRTDRLSSEFQKEITNIINRQVRSSHPELSVIVSVTGVEVSPDLKNAKVYISVFDTDKEKMASSYKTIAGSAAQIRYELAKSMNRIRIIPQLHFYADNSAEYGDRINQILNSLDIQPEDPADAEDADGADGAEGENLTEE
ncbi:MAG: 30S ribosome-binding factor RbfA [Clostridia bacterium]|nr:30S ribosome-binding factor RbfA [Clostridia bacterium]